MGLETIIGAGASILGGIGQASAAKKAANAQEAAANRDIAFQTETRDLTRGDLAPFRGAGNNALSAYNYLLGLGPKPTFGATAPQIETIAGAAQPMPQQPGIGQQFYGGHDNQFYNGVQRAQQPGSPTMYRVNGQTFGSMEEAQAYAAAHKTGGTPYGGFQATPGYQFAFDQGTAGVNALAGARGGLDSGRTRQDLMQFGQGIANQEFNNYLSRLGGLVDSGASAATASGNFSQNAASGVSGALSGIGNAQAAGAIGQGNAFAGMGQNLLGLYQYQQAQKQPASNQIQNHYWTGQGF